MTGHESGVITLSLAEADDTVRETLRISMGEPYRTLLGHFRHETGHYYWDKLVRDGGNLETCRAMFGDDREDYDAALQRHYAEGVPSQWWDSFVSAYATTHPWEISPKVSPIICTLSIPWRQPTPSVFALNPK